MPRTRYLRSTVAKQLERSVILPVFRSTRQKPLRPAKAAWPRRENSEWAGRMRMMSLHGISHDAWKRYAKEGSWYYEVLRPGFKYNLTDIGAAIGIEQLKKCDAFGAARNQYRGGLRRRVLSLTRDSDPGLRTRSSACLASLCDSAAAGTVKDYSRSIHRSFERARDWHLGALYSLAPASLLSRQISAMLRTIFQGRARRISGLSPCRSIPR